MNNAFLILLVVRSLLNGGCALQRGARFLGVCVLTLGIALPTCAAMVFTHPGGSGPSHLNRIAFAAKFGVFLHLS